jgi:hypothetical protein
MTPEERIKAAAKALGKKVHWLQDGERALELIRLVAPILNPEDFPPKPEVADRRECHGACAGRQGACRQDHLFWEQYRYRRRRWNH